jgi:3-dehydroquinate dehydratase
MKKGTNQRRRRRQQGKLLSSLERPFLCCVITETTSSKCIRLIDECEKQGAQAFELNLPQLKIGTIVRDIIASTTRPCIVTNRRAQFMELYGFHGIPVQSEETRAAKLIEALEAGASAIDFELDIFDEGNQLGKPRFGSKEELDYAAKIDSAPTEITRNSSAIRRQLDLVKEARELGGEVIISCHTQCRIKQRDITRIAKLIQDRGANYAKIVGITLGDFDLLAQFESVVKLNEELEIPFNVMNIGYMPILGRLVSVVFGSSWIYCTISKSRHSFSQQPTLQGASRFLGSFLPSRIRSIY